MVAIISEKGRNSGDSFGYVAFVTKYIRLHCLPSYSGYMVIVPG
jgi:hypothetical protein